MILLRSLFPKLLLAIVLTALIYSCNKSNTGHKIVNQRNGVHEMTATNKVTSYDQLIKYYIEHSDNKFLKLAHKNHDHIEWIMDRTEETDSAKYFVYNIGHDVAEEDSSNLRFVPYVWIYIDSLSKKLYEHDLTNDELIEWRSQ